MRLRAVVMSDIPNVAGRAPLVLDEDEALELLAYLVTAARTQIDEATEYGPVLLLTAAQRLGAAIAPRASESTAQFVTGPLAAVPQLVVPRDARSSSLPAVRATRCSGALTVTRVSGSPRAQCRGC